MTETVVTDGLHFKKPLHKMHERELRELVMEEFPMITSASSMNRDRLVAAIYDVTGMEEAAEPKNPHKDKVSEAKRQLAAIKAQLADDIDSKTKDRLKRRFKQLKKLSRKLSVSA